ncbi:hypothetical protein [Terracidiphilus gabretensis]|uniref:hypothetical protein n=1 Tax=Terracidiphilus gabretensis TaxID=1577687 RepID=UPI00071BAE4D|nr:hypothetical protein [Terracidiphilus gabretensis]
MVILLAFAPFLVFAIVNRLAGSEIGLAAAAATSAVLLLRDMLAPNRSPKILEIGTFVLFCGLALYGWFGHPAWTVIGVRVRVDAGLLVIVLVSMLVRRPFTLQYARERVAREHWNSSEFIRVNYVISSAWALAFAVMVIAELALLYVPNFPNAVGIAAIVIALVGAIKFTRWYPEHIRSRQLQQQ